MTRALLRIAFVVVAVLAVGAPTASAAPSEDTYDGSDLWLRYVRVDDRAKLEQYRQFATAIVVGNGRAPHARHAA